MSDRRLVNYHTPSFNLFLLDKIQDRKIKKKLIKELSLLFQLSTTLTYKKTISTNVRSELFCNMLMKENNKFWNIGTGWVLSQSLGQGSSSSSQPLCKTVSMWPTFMDKPRGPLLCREDSIVGRIHPPCRFLSTSYTRAPSYKEQKLCFLRCLL